MHIKVINVYLLQKASRSSDELRFDEIRPLVVRIASGLVKAGLKRGDVALACMNMRIEALPIALGVVAAGGIFTACNPQLTPGIEDFIS